MQFAGITKYLLRGIRLLYYVPSMLEQFLSHYRTLPNTLVERVANYTLIRCELRANVIGCEAARPRFDPLAPRK